MNVYFETLGIVVVFLIIFNFIEGRGTMKTYIYLSLLDILSLCILIRMIYIKMDIGDIAVVITLQVFYVLFVISYCRNTEKKQLFETIIESGFISIFFNGLYRLKKEEYLKIESCLKDCLGIDNVVIGKVYLFLSYTGKEVIIRYLFSNVVDYEEYINRKYLIDSNISDVEKNGNGMSVVYKVEI